MNCEGYDILLSARLDGELTREEEAGLAAHLAQCPRCRRQAQELEDLRRQTLSLTAEVPGRLKSWLADQDWAALPQDAPAGEPDETAPADPDLPLPLTPVQADNPPKTRRPKLPWLLCGAAAVLLLAVGLWQILLPNTMGGGFSQAMLEVFHQEEASLADREDAAQEEPGQAGPDSQQTGEPEEEQKTDDPQDSPDTPNTPGGNHPTTPDQGQQDTPGNQDTPSADPGQDDPNQGNNSQDDPSQGNNDQDPPPDDPPANTLLTQQQAQDLLLDHLAAQGRTLTLVPLGASNGAWRFSSKDDSGRVVSFLTVDQTTGVIHEVFVPPPDQGATAGPGAPQ